MRRPNLSADGYCDITGKLWSAKIYEHPAGGGEGKLVWEKHGMKSQYHSEVAMEAAWQRLMKQGATIDD